MKTKWKRNMGRVAVMALIFLGLLGSRHSAAVAQLNTSGTPTSIQMSLNVPETLTISATATGNTATFTGYNPVTGAAAANPITVVTSANIRSGHTALLVYGWLSSTTSALASSSTSTPVSAAQVLSQVNASGVGVGTAFACSVHPSMFTVVPASGVDNAYCIDQIGGDNSTIDQVKLPPGGTTVLTDVVNLSVLAPGLAPNSSGTPYVGVMNFEADCY
jgi:hypothetical protein